MILKMLVPPSEGFEMEGSHGSQIAVAMLTDNNDEIICVIDQIRGTYHIEKIIDKNAIFKFSHHNTMSIESDEEWEAYDKFFHDAGLGIVLDGMRLNNTGSLSL